MKRTFTVIDFPNLGDNYGHYVADSPGKAAHKALSHLARLINLKNTDNKNYIVFTLLETTNGGELNKKRKYIGTRVELHHPIKIRYGDKEIIHKYKPVVAKYKNYFEY